MTRVFTDTVGNEVVDIEYRLTLQGVIKALIANGTLDADAVELASDYRIIDVTAQRELERIQRAAAEQAEREAEAKALKNRPAEQKQAAAEFADEPVKE